MKNKSYALLLLAGLTCGGTLAQAQPGAGGGGFGGGGGGGFANMTPEQRAARMQQMREQQMTTQLTNLGYADTVQKAIIAFAQARETALTPLRATARTMQEGLNNNATAENLAKQLVDFRTAVAAEKTRRTAAEKELDTAVGYSKDAKLEAFLTLGGYIGEESSILANQNGGGRGGFGGGGGRGGFGGGGG